MSFWVQGLGFIGFGVRLPRPGPQRVSSEVLQGINLQLLQYGFPRVFKGCKSCSEVDSTVYAWHVEYENEVAKKVLQSGV